MTSGSVILLLSCLTPSEPPHVLVVVAFPLRICEDETKVLAEINVELQSGTDKPIEKLSQEKDSQEEAVGEFNSTLDNVIERLGHKKDSPDDFYGFMYDTDDDASISGKSSDFGWDGSEMDSPDTEVDWQEDPNHETEDLFAKGRKMANVQDEAIFDQEVAGDSLDDEEVE
nr:hypothetical protein [Tanacetum cinerariifolium]